jgi:hypothetical protein
MSGELGRADSNDSRRQLLANAAIAASRCPHAAPPGVTSVLVPLGLGPPAMSK